MKKLLYEKPLSALLQVEVENGFMNASVVEEKSDSSVTAGNQEIEGDYDFTDQTDIWQ